MRTVSIRAQIARFGAAAFVIASMLLFVPAYFSGFTQAQAYADEVDTGPVNLFAERVAPSLGYMYSSADGRAVYFDREAAARAVADGTMTEKQFEQGEWLESRFAGPIPPIGIRLWGNWCGPGISGPGAPIDQFDTTCMRHDACYMLRGLFDCYCDQLLIEEASLNRKYLSPQTQRLVKPTVAIFTAGSKVCRPH
ncbi:MAG: hypothetical protein Q3972_07270 [Corynebacterium sp.]|nr:hypothetical protein [Corynebacterium sp.]